MAPKDDEHRDDELEPGDDQPGDDEPGDDEPGDEELGGDELEPGDDEPGDDDREQLLAQVDGELSERAVKAREKALEREHSRHEGSLARAWGSLWEQFQLCPLCEGDGFMVPRPAGSMPEEQFAAVYAFAGQVQPAQLEPDQDYTVCDNCKGWGNTAIAGSALEGLSKQCDRCLGNGYVKSTAVNVLQLPQPAPIPGPALVAPVIPNYGSTQPDDQWGRPAGHVHYGIPPAAVT